MVISDISASKSTFAHLSDLFTRKPPQTLEARLELLCREVHGKKIFTSSLGMEDQCISHAVFSCDLDIEVITLDTGRLFASTYEVWARTEARYGKSIVPYYPERGDLENLVVANGINGFRASVEARKACCNVRKVVPLGRALEGAALWITGIRAEQSVGRAEMTFIEEDRSRGLVKANPLLDFDSKAIKTYLAENDVPINSLHAQGYPSIGCEPCTRAISEGENERAGRWWWENEVGGAAGGECGLHIGPDGRIMRTKKDN